VWERVCGSVCVCVRERESCLNLRQVRLLQHYLFVENNRQREMRYEPRYTRGGHCRLSEGEQMNSRCRLFDVHNTITAATANVSQSL
jgi:hypothetical protein